MKPPKLETYHALCTEFYELDKPVAPEDSYNFFLEYLKEARGPILEPMCGTGRFLIPFINAGFQVDGFDASPSMFQKLKEKCALAKISPNIQLAFFQEALFSQLYNLIYITCGSLGLITDLEEVKVCLKKIYNQLALGGKFVCEFEGMKYISSQFGSKTKSTKYLPNNQKLTFTLIPRSFKDNIDSMLCCYELFDNNQLIKEETELFQIRLYSEADILKLLNEAGFSKIKILKAFDRNLPPVPEDYTFIAECLK